MSFLGDALNCVFAALYRLYLHERWCNPARSAVRGPVEFAVPAFAAFVHRAQLTRTIDRLSPKSRITREATAASDAPARSRLAPRCIQLFQGARLYPRMPLRKPSTLPVMSRRCASRELLASRTITPEASARPDRRIDGIGTLPTLELILADLP